MKIHTIDFRVMTSFCSVGGGYQRFGGTHCLHLHDRSWTQFQTTTQCRSPEESSPPWRRLETRHGTVKLAYTLSQIIYSRRGTERKGRKRQAKEFLNILHLRIKSVVVWPDTVFLGTFLRLTSFRDTLFSFGRTRKPLIVCCTSYISTFSVLHPFTCSCVYEGCPNSVGICLTGM
jgi:hypothetical protein